MNMRFARVLAAGVALATLKLIALGPAIAPADIVGVTGSAKIYHDPTTVARDIWESNRRTRVFEEQTGVVLSQDLHVDITSTGRVDDDSAMSPGFLTEGTTVDSYFVHQDPIGPIGHLHLTGKIFFSEEILAVIIDRHTLADTDALLGNPNTEYPDGIFARGLDFKQPLEFIKISEDRHKLKYSLYTTTAMDQIRILTQYSAAPTPASAVLLLGGLAGFSRRRRAA